MLVLVKQDNLSDATRLLMERYGTAMFRYACAEVRDPALADDVRQVVFIEAHRDLRRFAGDSTLRVWLFGIARHRVLDAVKKRRRIQRHYEDADGTDAVDPYQSPGESIDDARARCLLYQCLDKLNDKSRIAVLMHYLMGFTFEEMARICGEKPGTLHARVTRALHQLRVLIARARTPPGKPTKLR
ncbi:MAG: RNA polymerase sigma factor [Kofleriaceae bacterium]